MPETTIRHIPGKAIPEEWKHHIHDSLEGSFTVIIRPEDSHTKPEKESKNRWALLAEERKKNSPLEGMSSEMIKHAQEFRDNFAFDQDKE